MAEAKTRPDRYGLIGHPVKHSHSPVIHGLFAKQTRQNITYELIDASIEAFEPTIDEFRGAGGKGLNVTLPHKQHAYRIADSSEASAQAAQAANTLTFEDTKIAAANTDGIGLIRDLETNLKLSLRDKKVLILGAGGAARGIVLPLLRAGVRLTVANRTMARAVGLKKLLNSHGRIDVCSFDELADLPAQDLVVNATSAGVKGQSAPFPPELFGSGTFCYDLSYSIHDTPFVKLARAHGAAEAVQGWGMLIEQAAESFSIWRGVRPETAEILAKLRR
jgi:shikimate dehydrogenase